MHRRSDHRVGEGPEQLLEAAPLGIAHVRELLQRQLPLPCATTATPGAHHLATTDRCPLEHPVVARYQRAALRRGALVGTWGRTGAAGKRRLDLKELAAVTPAQKRRFEKLFQAFPYTVV